MNPWLILIIGVILGWIISWLVELFLFRKKTFEDHNRVITLERDLQTQGAELAATQGLLAEYQQANLDYAEGYAALEAELAAATGMVLVEEGDEVIDETLVIKEVEFESEELEIVSEDVLDSKDEEIAEDEEGGVEAEDLLAAAAVAVVAGDDEEDAGEAEDDEDAVEAESEIEVEDRVVEVEVLETDAAESAESDEEDDGIGIVEGVVGGAAVLGAAAVAVVVGDDEEDAGEAEDDEDAVEAESEIEVEDRVVEVEVLETAAAESAESDEEDDGIGIVEGVVGGAAVLGAAAVAVVAGDDEEDAGEAEDDEDAVEAESEIEVEDRVVEVAVLEAAAEEGSEDEVEDEEASDEAQTAIDPQELANAALLRIKYLKLDSIKGVGAATVKKFEAVGINTVSDLLERVSTPRARQELAEETGLAPANILTWANRADLTRIRGVASGYADLLEAAGVNTVPQLAQRNPKQLHAKLVETNQQRLIVKKVPSVKQIEDWVSQARLLPRLLNY